MMDAYSHYAFLAQHRREAIEAVKICIAAIFSPVGSVITMALGGLYLVMDSRAKKPTLLPAPPSDVSLPNLPVIVDPSEVEDLPTQSSLDLPLALNIVAVRAEAEFIPDPNMYDSGDRAFVAYFHNEPRPDATIGTASSVTATISYKFALDKEQKSMFEFARSIKAPWITKGGFQTNHVGFEVNSIRQLILGVEGTKGHFFALENLGDEPSDKKTESDGYDVTSRIKLGDMIVGTRWLACVRFTIDGRVSSKEYRFVLNLSDNPSCCREEDEIPF